MWRMVRRDNGVKGLVHSLVGTRGVITRKGRDSEEIRRVARCATPMWRGTKKYPVNLQSRTVHGAGRRGCCQGRWRLQFTELSLLPLSPWWAPTLQGWLRIYHLPLGWISQWYTQGTLESSSLTLFTVEHNMHS